MDNEILQKIKIGSANPSTTDPEDDISDLIDQMPPHVKEVYFASSTADEIYKATKESGVPEDLVPKAAFLLGDMFLGILDPKDFTHELINFGIPEASAVNFYRAISQSILLKIKSELDQMYGPEPVSAINIEEKLLPPQSPEPHLARPEIPQQEESVTRIKVEAPPLRRVTVHHLQEDGGGEVATQQTELRQARSEPHLTPQIQPKINDPYREKVDEA